MGIATKIFRTVTLLTGWAAYWTGLALIVLPKPLVAALQLSQLPEGHASASANFTNLVFNVTMLADGKTVWAGSMHAVVIALWLFGPPLAMLIATLSFRKRVLPVADQSASSTSRLSGTAQSPYALGEGAFSSMSGTPREREYAPAGEAQRNR